MDQPFHQRSRGRLLGTATLPVVIVLGFSGPAAAHTVADGFHHHDGRMDSLGGASGSLWTTLWMVVSTGIPLGFGYRLLTQRGSGDRRTDDASTVLQRRYAEGEIDEEEFDTRRRKLRGGE